VNEYIEPAEPFITRTEFVGGKFLYALKVDTTGGFELCPADECQAGDAFCPTDAEDGNVEKAKFEIIENYTNDDLPIYEQFLKINGMEIAAIEYIISEDGQRYVYDVNINTNYNSAAEARSTADIYGMQAIAEYLGEELEKVNDRELSVLKEM